MKKNVLITIIVLAVIGMIAAWLIGRYNIMVTMEENVENAWGQVENQYQRRIDLIPNLVSTVKGYATHEQSTYTAVMEARAKATQITIDPANATPEQLAAYQNAQGELSQALGRLLAVTENYPELKANENFKQLMDQLEGTENRITVARQRYNDVARKYNTKVRSFPANIIANMGGFEKKTYFAASAEAQSAPKVDF